MIATQIETPDGGRIDVRIDGDQITLTTVGEWHPDKPAGRPVVVDELEQQIIRDVAQALHDHLDHILGAFYWPHQERRRRIWQGNADRYKMAKALKESMFLEVETKDEAAVRLSLFKKRVLLDSRDNVGDREPIYLTRKDIDELQEALDVARMVLSERAGADEDPGR